MIMGFGLILCGYTLSYLMSLNSFGFAFRLLGCAVMLSGLRKVSQFEPLFRYARLSAIIMAAFAAIEAILSLLRDLSNFRLISVFGNVWNTDELITAAFVAFGFASVIFHVFLYAAVKKISSDVGLDKISRRALKSAVLAVMLAVLVGATYITFYLKLSVVNYLYAAAILLFYIIVFLNIYLFYSCYKNICEEGDENAPRRDSKIPFLNRLWDVSEKREQEIYNKTKAYAENKIKQDNAKKHRRKKKK